MRNRSEMRKHAQATMCPELLWGVEVVSNQSVYLLGSVEVSSTMNPINNLIEIPKSRCPQMFVAKTFYPCFRF